MNVSREMMLGLLRLADSMGPSRTEEALFLYSWIHTADLRSRAQAEKGAAARRRDNRHPRSKPFVLEASPAGRTMLPVVAGMETGVRMRLLIEKLESAKTEDAQSAALRDLDFFALEHPPTDLVPRVTPITTTVVEPDQRGTKETGGTPYLENGMEQLAEDPGFVYQLAADSFTHHRTVKKYLRGERVRGAPGLRIAAALEIIRRQQAEVSK